MMKFGTTFIFLLVFLYSFSQNPIKELQGASDKAQEILWRSNRRPLTPSKYVNPFIFNTRSDEEEGETNEEIIEVANPAPRSKSSDKKSSDKKTKKCC